MTKEINRRLLTLERAQHGVRFRYTISDRALSDDEWQAELQGVWLDEEEHLSPLMSEAEWLAAYGMIGGS